MLLGILPSVCSPQPEVCSLSPEVRSLQPEVHSLRFTLTASVLPFTRRTIRNYANRLPRLAFLRRTGTHLAGLYLSIYTTHVSRYCSCLTMVLVVRRWPTGPQLCGPPWSPPCLACVAGGVGIEAHAKFLKVFFPLPILLAASPLACQLRRQNFRVRLQSCQLRRLRDVLIFV